MDAARARKGEIVLTKMKSSMNSIDYKLFSTLLVMGLLPTIYTTVRIFFLGDMPSDWGFNIASQLSWVNLVYEILQEAIMLPLFYLIGKSIQNKEELSNKIKSGLIVTLLIYSLISLVFLFFAEPIITFMSQKSELIKKTALYIRLETIASIFSTLAQFTVLVLITLKKDKILLAILSLQMLATVLLDSFLVSSLPISLNIGVNGIAITNIIVNIIILTFALIVLAKQKVIVKTKITFSWMKEWIKVGGYSGIESFVRNIAFMLMVVRMVNVVGEQGTFWVANNFIWGWLLLPIMQLGQLIKRDCGESGEKAIKEKTLGYFGVTTIIVILWVITIPFWEPLEGYNKSSVLKHPKIQLKEQKDETV
jgi:Na+-driven multidrug efflux pump